MIQFIYAHIALLTAQRHPELFTAWHSDAIVNHWYEAHNAVVSA